MTVPEGRQRVVDWWFRNRRTGRITIAQFPNPALWTWVGISVVRRVADPAGTLGRALAAAGSVALAVWALDEVVRGVNPFRRLLGAGVLVAQAVALVW